MKHRNPPITHYPLFWDTLIVLLLVTCGWGLIVAERIDRARLDVLIAAASLFAMSLLLYGSFIESRRIVLNKKSIRLSSLPKLKILVIADFHVGPYKRTGYMRTIVRKASELHADIILIPGDFIFDHRSNLKHLEPLRDLRSQLGTFATLGNHDSGRHIIRRLFQPAATLQMLDRSDDVTNVVQTLGITMLRNASKIIEYNDEKFAIAGIDDPWMESSDLDAAFQNIDKHIPMILLSHNPDIILDERSHRASLIVSGHTHGGQIRLPFYGSIYPIPNKLGRTYDHGIFPVKDSTTLAITHGIGETMTRARLFCPPEILLLEINS